MGLGGQLDNPAVNSMERTPLLVVEKVGLAPRPIWVGVARSDIPTALYRHYTDCTIQTALYRLHYTDCTIPALYRLHYTDCTIPTALYRLHYTDFTIPTALYRHLQAHKGNVHPTTSHNDPQVEKGNSCTLAWVLNATLQPLYPGEENRYPLYRRLGGPRSRSGWVRKISPAPRFDSRTLQYLASCYTDWAVLAPFTAMWSMEISTDYSDIGSGGRLGEGLPGICISLFLYQASFRMLLVICCTNDTSVTRLEFVCILFI